MLSTKQKEYLTSCSHRWNLKVGATGSGKSWLDYAVVIPQRLLALRGEGAAVMLGNTQGTLSRNVLDPMREIWGEALVGTISSDNTARLFGRRVHILGADSKKHVARIQGITIEYGYGDEMTTWDEDVFQMLKTRLRCPHSHFDGTANPDSQEHFLKKVHRRPQGGYFLSDLHPSTITRSSRKEFVEKPEARAVRDGLIMTVSFWGIGAMLPVWSILSFRSARTPTSSTEARRASTASFTYPSTTAPTTPCSMGLWVIHDGRALRVRESYFDSRKQRMQRTDEEHYADLERLTKGYYVQAVCVDPSAASFIETIRRHGKYQVIPADNDVLNGIRCVASLMQAGLVQIHESCTDSRREFGVYSWGRLRRKKTGSSRKTTTPWTTSVISVTRYSPRSSVGADWRAK